MARHSRRRFLRGTLAVAGLGLRRVTDALARLAAESWRSPRPSDGVRLALLDLAVQEEHRRLPRWRRLAHSARLYG